MLFHDMMLNSTSRPANPSFTGENYIGAYTRNTDFTVSLTTAPSPYRYIFIIAEMGQAATGTQYPITFQVNSVSVTGASASVSNDGNNSASSTSAHTLVRIPTGTSVTIRISHGYPVNGMYQVAILELPFLSYNFSTSTFGGAGSSYGPFSISETTNGLVLASFAGTYGSSAGITFTGVTRLPGNVVNGLLSMSGGYAFSTTTGTRSVSVSHTSTDGRVTIVSSWAAGAS